MKVISDLELCGVFLEVINKQLAEGQKRIRVSPQIAWYTWNKRKTKQEKIVAKRLKSIFEEVLANYSILTDPEHRQLEILYWSALNAGIVEEKHLSKLYKIIHTVSHFPSKPWYAREARVALPILLNMVKSKDLDAARLAAVSLSAIPEIWHFPHERIEIKEVRIGEKYWEFAQDKKDIWRSRYIEGLGKCRLKWAEKGEGWFRAMKEANTEELQWSWSRVIEGAGYYEAKDQKAFFNLLLNILESRDIFAKAIRSAALRRLDEIVYEVEPVGFDEESLNLPLSRRVGTSFS